MSFWEGIMSPRTLSELIHALQHNSRVLGLIEFGNDHSNDHYTVGDYDLFAVLTAYPSTVTSLHFYVGRIPIDLNFITRADLEQLTVGNYFRWAALRDGRVIYDPYSVITPALMRLQTEHATRPASPLSENTMARTRHWHRHILDKVRGRLDTVQLVVALSCTATWPA